MGVITFRCVWKGKICPTVWRWRRGGLYRPLKFKSLLILLLVVGRRFVMNRDIMLRDVSMCGPHSEKRGKTLKQKSVFTILFFQPTSLYFIQNNVY
jgi:hypothetical protein